MSKAGIQSVTCDATSGSTFPPGETVVTCTATDNAGNTSSDSFTITVGYGGGIGIFANKYNVKDGSSNQLRWAWQDQFENNIDSSGVDQLLCIVDCDDPMIVFEMAGNRGSSGFRFKSDNNWEYNWQTDRPNTGAPLKGTYCPSVESGPTHSLQPNQACLSALRASGERPIRGFAVFGCVCRPSSRLIYVHWQKPAFYPSRILA